MSSQKIKGDIFMEYCNGKKEDCGKVESTTLPLCPGVNITPTGICGPVVAKIPVVLAQREVQIDVESNIYLKKPLFEIKRIKKDVFLTQCKLIPRAGIIENGVPRTGKLFISGYVRKNIEYATSECREDKIVKGEINHITAKIPFTCVTEVTYVVPPVINLRGFSREIDLLCTKQGDCKICEEEFMGRSLCETEFEETVFYNEKPYCELISARIFEADIQRCEEENWHKEDCLMEKEANYEAKDKKKEITTKLTEKMVVFITVKVLQVQQVNIC